jgi:Putative transmembrane protein (PGPGW).
MAFVAVVLLIVGIILCFIPGPGIPFVIIGAGLLAEQFRGVASALDWCELKLRRTARRGKTWWCQASIPTRGMAALLIAAAIAGISYGTFQAVIRY